MAVLSERSVALLHIYEPCEKLKETTYRDPKVGIAELDVYLDLSDGVRGVDKRQDPVLFARPHDLFPRENDAVRSQLKRIATGGR